MDKRQRRLRNLQHHLTRLERRLTALHTLSDQFSRWRLFAFLGGIGLLLASVAVDTLLAAFVMTAWLVGFVLLVRRHAHVDLTVQQFQQWMAIKHTHIARMQLDWHNIPPSDATPPPDHPFAVDLDITGEYSLHRLLDTTVTQRGTDRLLDRLLYPTLDQATIEAQQHLITELMPLTTFRDRLTMNAQLARGKRRETQWDSEVLLRWLQNDTGGSDVSVGSVLFLATLSAVNIVLFVLANVAGLPPLWIVTTATFLALSGRQWRKLASLFSEALTLNTQVNRLSNVFGHLESYNYSRMPELAALCQPFTDPRKRPSAQLRRIGWITTAASIQRNVVLWAMLNFIIPWDITFGFLLARSKGNLADTLPEWLDRLYSLETANALATFAYLNPHYTLPRIQPDTILEGEQVGHPLIPHVERVCNLFTIQQRGTVVIITGSNMSGKSSFLRALGLNLVLSYAGTVTVAQTFNIGLLRLYTSIRVTDSVVDGFSYFYAEVRRLKGLLDTLRAEEEYPVFFLIDEIFRGTNNRERLVGSRSYLRALLAENGAGLIATHDLELVHLEEESERVQNYHFRESVIDGKMTFDYLLREGPCPTTNALKIMQIEGLPVEDIP